jgi:hypothetical protein
VAFHQLETEVIAAFRASRPIGAEWDDSPLRSLLPTAPATKASFARRIIERLAAEAGVSVNSLPGRAGSRRKIGNSVCEIKFSTEDPARFQQVRPPTEGYDHLIAIGAHPRDLVYWVIPAADVLKLIDEGHITYQHAEDSLWFFPEAAGNDPFASYRTDADGVIAAFASFR